VKNYNAKKEKNQVFGFEDAVIAEAMAQGRVLNLEELARLGAQRLIARALILEVDGYLEEHANERDEKGNHLVHRNGTAREREILTGVGPITIKQPRVDDRKVDDKFISSIIPKYARRAPSIDTLMPILYLRGVSTGEFNTVLESILGKGHGVSANTVMRLKKEWEEEYKQWRKRTFDSNEYCYIWADGIYTNNRDKDDPKSCHLIIIGVNQHGEKEFLAIESGIWESSISWKELLLDLKSRGLKPPKLAIGYGAMGFWHALKEVYPTTREQRCWVHKTANVIDKLPKKLQPKEKEMLYEIYYAPDRKEAEKQMKKFVDTFDDKYPKATKCLTKDKDVLLTFYDFPAKHFQHIRTSNPIESTFATVRLRTQKMRNCGNRTTNLTMLFKLSQVAQKSWRKLRGFRDIPLVLEGRIFSDGVLVEDSVA